MKASEAPPAGWYPDPEGRSQLRWWEGTDWSDRYRARPYTDLSRAAPPPVGSTTPPPPSGYPGNPGRSMPAVEGAALVEQMRVAARGEVDRAAQLFDQRTRQIQASFKPLITEYTSKLIRLLKLAAVFTVMVVIAYFVFQAFAQKSLFDWIGDRIDNLTDESGSAAISQAASLVATITRG